MTAHAMKGDHESCLAGVEVCRRVRRHSCGQGQDRLRGGCRKTSRTNRSRAVAASRRNGQHRNCYLVSRLRQCCGTDPSGRSSPLLLQATRAESGNPLFRIACDVRTRMINDNYGQGRQMAPEVADDLTHRKSKPGYAESPLEASTHWFVESAMPSAPSTPPNAGPTYVAAATLQLSVKCSSQRGFFDDPELMAARQGAISIGSCAFGWRQEQDHPLDLLFLRPPAWEEWTGFFQLGLKANGVHDRHALPQLRLGRAWRCSRLAPDSSRPRMLSQPVLGRRQDFQLPNLLRGNGTWGSASCLVNGPQQRPCQKTGRCGITHRPVYYKPTSTRGLPERFHSLRLMHRWARTERLEAWSCLMVCQACGSASSWRQGGRATAKLGGRRPSGHLGGLVQRPWKYGCGRRCPSPPAGPSADDVSYVGPYAILRPKATPVETSPGEHSASSIMRGQ